MIRIRQVIAIAICLFLGIFSLRAQVPVADFTASTTAGCGPLTVHFSDQSSNNPTFWAWDFGNGQISSAQNPSMIYGTPGTYTVTLIVKNSSGAASIIKKDYITVYPFPTAQFTSNLQVGCAPATIQFTDQSTPGQGSIVSRTWNLGDGQISSDPNPSHVYTQTGYYSISLNVTNSGGCSISTTINRYIRIVQGVQPDFTWSQTSGSCSAPFDITFVNQTAGPGTLTYTWDLGNGTPTSTQTNPSTNYPTNNPYTINLTATSSLGCSASTSKTFSFQGNTPVITAPDNACLNMPVAFQNGSSPAPVSSTWNFGDGTNSSFPNPQKAYATPGTYTVTLTNTYASCSSSATKTITVGTAAPASFTADKPRGCSVPATINFTDQTVGGTGWLWDFGDGTTSTQQNPSHTYTTFGYYDVSLNVTTNTGCSNALTKTQYIRLGPPAVSVAGLSTRGCVGDPIHPSPGVSAPDGVASYLWTAPGATPSSSTSPTPAFTYGAEGNYDITFQITTNGGCTATQTFPGIAIIGNKVPAAFTATPTTSCVRGTITFTSTSPSIDQWLWNFGDGSTSTIGPTITHYYTDTGFNDVMLSVTHHGCTQSTFQSKYIYINPPLAGFDFKINCADRHVVSFTDTSKVDPNPAKPVTYLWDFGDGTTSTAQTPPPHTFTNLNPQNVTLTVTQGSCTDVAKTPITLQPVTPSFTITPNPVCRNSDFTVTSTSTPATGISTYTWTVNTGTRTTNNPNFTTSIPDTGAHVIELVVTDNGGCPFGPVTNTVQITGPTAKLATGIGGCKNNIITFTDQSTPYRTDAINSWFLDFGDGNTQNFPSLPLTHTYADTGTYNVIIAVKDAKGCVDTARVTTPVKISSARAGFFARDTVYCPDAPVPFTDSSKGNNLTYSWNFGDGAAGSTMQNPTHIYTGYTGTGQYYNVKLKITDGAGCSDSVTYNNYIHIQKPIAAFTLDDSAGICTPMATDFTPAGKYYDSLYWDFGDHTTSTLDTVTHFYNNYGPAANNYAYVAKLVLQGAGGCRDSAMRNVYVYQPNTATSLTFSPTSQCDSLTANFVVTPPPYIGFTFAFGDGPVDTSGSTTLSHTYKILGTYSPQVILQDASGCIASVGRGAITVLGSVPIFTMNKKNVCDTGTIYFQGIVISNDGQSNLTWDFADGTTLTSPTPTGHPDDPFLTQTHFYSQPGVRLATLKVTTNSGCNESYTDTIHIWQTPHPLISADGPLCTGPIQFHGNVTIPNIDSVAYAWTFSNGSNSSSKDPNLQFPSGPLIAYLKTSVAFGCNDTTSQPVNIFPLPEIKGPRVLTTPVGIPVTLPFTYSSNVNTYTWSPSTYLDCTDCPTPVSTPVFNTTYTITVTDENHCTATDTVLVKTICGGENYFIPNTFSPNNDGVNDVFYPRGKGLHDIQSMRIFNRWGQLVFERKNFPANSASMGWDGTINGRPAPSDAYVYIIEVICINAQIVALKGDVTLIR
ncbi:MAG: PKD domain-containing protein [Chitinophagaceae bacterium]|nr:PKD domain-containing protein [Chitinophagaceae bacterium]